MKNANDTETIQIVSELKNNPEKAYTLLYTQYASLLYGFAFNLTKSESISEDIVQEAFIKIWINRKDLHIETSIKSYLFKMVQNMCIDSFRRQIINPEIIGYLEIIQDSQISSTESCSMFDMDEFEERLKEAKKKLTQQQRLIFVLIKEDEKKVKDVAELLEISEQSVRNQLSAALAKLRVYMKEYFPIFVIMFYNT